MAQKASTTDIKGIFFKKNPQTEQKQNTAILILWRKLALVKTNIFDFQINYNQRCCLVELKGHPESWVPLQKLPC